ncbi:hypothetical protein SCP_0302670 [Sparassis crispa]|uniref:Uncharacterized protein n=1 Tax=Sparassis crispa TaxID=139825 RepID=A0A401GEE5_9APHY|nr:hypothetical protein SCP_0302670 [Sparassis crispa]GBE80552.1 hypothetical protein SCP_0302670 [Sparassis crispa]
MFTPVSDDALNAIHTACERATELQGKKPWSPLKFTPRGLLERGDKYRDSSLRMLTTTRKLVDSDIHGQYHVEYDTLSKDREKLTSHNTFRALQNRVQFKKYKDGEKILNRGLVTSSQKSCGEYIWQEKNQQLRANSPVSEEHELSNPSSSNTEDPEQRSPVDGAASDQGPTGAEGTQATPHVKHNLAQTIRDLAHMLNPFGDDHAVDESHHRDGANSAIHETSPDNDGEGETSRDDRGQDEISRGGGDKGETIRDNNGVGETSRQADIEGETSSDNNAEYDATVSLCSFTSDNSAGPSGTTQAILSLDDYSRTSCDGQGFQGFQGFQGRQKDFFLDSRG